MITSNKKILTLESRALLKIELTQTFPMTKGQSLQSSFEENVEKFSIGLFIIFGGGT